MGTLTPVLPSVLVGSIIFWIWRGVFGSVVFSFASAAAVRAIEPPKPAAPTVLRKSLLLILSGFSFIFFYS